MPKLSEIRKTITVLVTGAIGWGASVIASPSAAITAPEWLAAGVIVATAAGVYSIANEPS